MTEPASAGGGGERVAVVLFTDSFKIDGLVEPPADGGTILGDGDGVLVVYDCKIYDRLQKDKFIFGMSRMEVNAKSVEIALPRNAVTKEGVF